MWNLPVTLEKVILGDKVGENCDRYPYDVFLFSQLNKKKVIRWERRERCCSETTCEIVISKRT